MIGDKILHYKILEKLGEGGMGVVYLAEDTKLERKVAIKFLPKNIAGNHDDRERFKIEAKAAAALNHRNITTIHSIEEVNDELFIVMEYINGVELSDIIKSGIITPEETVKIAVQIADGLGAAHKEGIIHRDIKSSNIMITEDGIVKIMDFGLAKVKGGSKLTQVGSTIGTIAYMSPEQAKGDEVDHRTDIWSFGIILYEMLTGKMPFRGDYDQAIIYSILNEETWPAERIDKGLQNIINKALKKNQDERYQNAWEIGEDLRTISGGGTVKKYKREKKISWMIAAAAIILVVFILYIFIPSSNTIKENDAIKTIAVLPFVNMSPDPGQKYFSDGLSEALINVLSKNPKLRVTAPTSSFSFEGTKTDIKTIAQKLNVKNILEGSVQKSDNTLRISADLVNVDNESTLWSNTYDGTLKNIFALQDSISHSVAKALDAALLGKEAEVSEKGTDPEAYNEFLLGKHFFDLRGKENFEMASSHYKKALAIDSNYAPAWVGLASTHSALADNGNMPMIEGYRKARQEVEEALQLDPNLAEAYSFLGWIKWSYDWDWSGAEESYHRALTLEPENASVIRNLAALESTLGRFKKAIELTRHSIELNPVSSSGYNNLGLYSWYAGLLVESVKAHRKCLELNPQYPGAHTFIGRVYLLEGQLNSALIEIGKETDPFWQLYGFALVNYTLGKKNESDIELTTLIKKDQYDSAYQIAEIYAYRGEKDKAFDWLERAYNQRDGGLVAIKGDPLLHNIEKNSRYKAFIEKMKLPM